MIIVYSNKKSFETAMKSQNAKKQPRLKNGRFAKPLPKESDLKNSPVVSFSYPRSNAPWNLKDRTVRLISANATHITGLEQTNGGWKYKKFCANKMRHFNIVSFNEKAMS